MTRRRCLMFYPWNLNDRSGALDALLQYSRALQRAGYRLDCFAPKGAPDAVSDGLCYGVFENVFVMPDRESPMTRRLEAIGAEWEDPLLSEKVGRDDASMAAAGVLASIFDYDFVGVHYARCHSLRNMLPPGMPTVMFMHDLDSLVCRQEEMIFGVPADYTLADEAERVKGFDLVTVFGPDDRDALLSVAPELPVVVAPFTAPLDPPASSSKDSPGILLWISSAASFHRMSFFWFWQNVWPHIRAARPECRLIIAGRISETAKQLGAALDPQVSVLGVVEDAEQLYREADILIAPYYFGLGIKTKVIEALARGLPVATTTLGITNTRIQPGRDAVVSDDAGEYADQVIRLISCPELRYELSRNGREYVRARHDPERALTPFVEAVDRIVQKKKTSLKSRAGALRHLQEPLRHLIPWVVQRCRDEGVGSIAVYGAGSHTRLLVPIWQSLGGPAIRSIIVSGEPSESILMGIPVERAERFDKTRVDAVVLSSQGYEQDMAIACNTLWPEMPVFPIWRPLQPSENFEAICQEKIPAALHEL